MQGEAGDVARTSWKYRTDELLNAAQIDRLKLSGGAGRVRKLTLGIGVFDGVHLGHRRVIDEVSALAQATHSIPAAMTFDPHPRALLDPDESPVLLVPLKERIRLLREAGAEEVWVQPFTMEFARLEPEQFLERLLTCPGLELAGVCVGEKWRFGRGARGRRETISAWAEAHRLAFRASPELHWKDEVVSSSAIRRAVSEGKFEQAAAMLGRPYRLIGTVECGHHAAAGQLDCPTANLAFSAGVLPPDGVYAAEVYRDGVPYAAAVNIGFGPTFGWNHAKRRVEAHLLDFTGNLYNCELGVVFLRYLRAERVFSTPEELKRQIGSDLLQVRKLFADQPASEGLPGGKEKQRIN